MKLALIVTTIALLTGCAVETQVQTSNYKKIQPSSGNALSIPIVSDGDILFVKDDSSDKFSTKQGYQITELDKALIAAPNVPISFKTYTGDNGNILSVPVFKMRQVQKSGVNNNTGQYWKINIKELSLDVFEIYGVNSNGENINKKCFSLAECFEII